MNQKLYITVFVTIAMFLLPSQAGEVGESSSKSQSNEHGSNLFEENKKLQDEDKLCDVTIIVGDKSFRAHKNILSSASPYFKAMFTNENVRESLGQSNEQTITLHELDAEVFEMLKDYMYTSRITIDDSTAQRLLAGASYLQMTNVKVHCCAHMKKEVNVENCIGIKYIADKYSCSELLNYATEFTLDAFEEVTLSDEFLELTSDQLISIISEDSLNVESEEKAYEAVMRWIRYQEGSESDRTVHLPYILQHVRFSQMEPNYLFTVSQDPLIKACKQCTEYVKEAENHVSSDSLINKIIRWMSFHRTSRHDDGESSPSARFKSRKKWYLFAVGGFSGSMNDYTSSVERYDPRTNKWTEMAPMNRPRGQVGVAALNNILYAVGGYNYDTTFLNTVECYDPSTDKWTDNLKPLERDRDTYNRVATLNGVMYITGDASSTQSVVKYDPNIDELIECRALRHVRWDYAVEALDGYIYAFGGFRDQVLNTVERYDPTQNEWHDVSPMIAARYYCATAAHEDYLYAVGGVGRASDLNSAERYDSRKNRWEEIAPMTEQRMGHGLAVANGLIYAAGGRDSNRNWLNSVEVYDPTRNTWSIRAPMLNKRGGLGLAAMKS